jgi:hypothetical protein
LRRVPPKPAEAKNCEYGFDEGQDSVSLLNIHEYQESEQQPKPQEKPSALHTAVTHGICMNISSMGKTEV